jgi:hypothetical protein
MLETDTANCPHTLMYVSSTWSASAWSNSSKCVGQSAVRTCFFRYVLVCSTAISRLHFKVGIQAWPTQTCNLEQRSPRFAPVSGLHRSGQVFFDHYLEINWSWIWIGRWECCMPSYIDIQHCSRSAGSLGRFSPQMLAALVGASMRWNTRPALATRSHRQIGFDAERVRSVSTCGVAREQPDAAAAYAALAD